MYLFKDQPEVEIPVTCKFCLKNVVFKISEMEYRDITDFPIIREDIHGTPEHKLIVSLNKHLEVVNFEIKDLMEKEVEYSQDLTREVLSEIDLNDEEIELYFLSTGRDAVSVGEMALLIDKSKEECEVIAEKFVQKGLFKKIVGAIPHYTALPPYAALISQLQSFKSFISAIRENVPPELKHELDQLEGKAEGVRELKDYIDFMNKMKQDMLINMGDQKKSFEDGISEMEKIKDISDVIGTLEGDTKKIMDGQIEDLSTDFTDIKKRISNNLQKLRLGVIQQTVDQVVQKIFAEGLVKIKAKLDTQFSTKLKKILDPIDDSISNITKSAVDTGENIKTIFKKLGESFSQTIIKAEDNLTGVSDVVFESFNTLRDRFENEIIKTLEDVLDQILERLDVNEKVTAEFWNRARSVTSFTMQDIWFVRSMEGAKAHINEQISKAKMRLLIVTPEITDIDMEAIKAIPRHINIRITASIERDNKIHMNILAHLEGMENVTYRNRKMQNLWGINRDYEEVILCVLSKGEKGTEIAGIGSIIEEHIKIFVPILEEAWVGALKEKFDVKPIKDVPPARGEKGRALAMKAPATKKVGAKAPKLKFDLKPIEKEAEALSEEVKESIVKTEKGIKLNKEQLSSLFDSVEKQIDQKSGAELSELLKNLHDAIEISKGSSDILEKIKHVAFDLSDKVGKFSISERYEIKKKVTFWRKKLRM